MVKLERDRVIVLFLSLLAVAFSFFSGRGRSITLDEATTLYSSYHAFHHDLSSLFAEIHTPSYDVLLGLWLSLSGFDLAHAKLFSAIVSALGVATTYAFACRIFDRRTAAFAGLLLACSPLNAYYGQYARTYALFIAASTLSSYAYFVLVQQPSKRSALLYLASTYLLVCSHFVGFTLVGVQWIHFLWLLPPEKRNLKLWLSVQGGLGLLYAPFLAAILHRYDLVHFIPRVYAWVPLPHFVDLGRAFFFLSGASPACSILLAVPVTIAIWRPAVDPRRVSYLLLWLWLPMLSLFAYSYLHAPIFIPRGFAPSAVPWLLLAALGLSRLPGKPLVAWGLVAGIIALSGLAIEERRFGEQEDWAPVAARIRRPENETASSRPLVFVSPAYAALPLVYYFAPECFYSPDLDPCLAKNGIYPVDGAEEIRARLAGGTREAWFVGYTVTQEKNLETVKQLTADPQLKLASRSTSYLSIELSHLTPKP